MERLSIFALPAWGRRLGFNTARAAPVIEAKQIAALGGVPVALAALEAAAGLQVRFFIRAFEALGFALGAAVVGVLLRPRTVGRLGRGGVGAQEPQPQAKE